VIPAITLDELVTWNCQSADWWKAHLDSNPALLVLPCGIGGNIDVQAFVRHIWGAELVWSQILAGLPVTDYDVWPKGPMNSLFDLHLAAVENFRALLGNPNTRWDERSVHYPWRPPELPMPTPRKALAHVLFHSQRHWAQVATLVRTGGFPSGFKGDLLFSSALV
jgi:uncharacterized damage-inducible protein DinB